MPNVNHPDGERLSALAGRDPQAADDATLVAHVASCDRCAELVRELGALRAALAELPDLAPPRPLRLLPPAEGAAHDRFTTWARRLFAPALAAGTALALVGAVGTTGFGIPTPEGGAPSEAYQPEPAASAAAAEEFSDGGTAAMEDGDARASASARITAGAEGSRSSDALADELPAERSPWPMVLFSGVALIVVAAMLRWIIVPRAG